jgi:hypothetical protein
MKRRCQCPTPLVDHERATESASPTGADEPAVVSDTVDAENAADDEAEADEATGDATMRVEGAARNTPAPSTRTPAPPIKDDDEGDAECSDRGATAGDSKIRAGASTAEKARAA